MSKNYLTTRRRRAVSVTSTPQPSTQTSSRLIQAISVPYMRVPARVCPVNLVSSRLPAGIQVVKSVRVVVAPLVRMPRQARPTIVRYNKPANAPPVPVPTKSVVVRIPQRQTIFGRMVQPPPALRRIAAIPNPTPTPYPDPQGSFFPPFIRVMRRPPSLPPKTIPTVVRSRPGIPCPTSSIVTRRFPIQARVIAPRVVASGTIYQRSESGVYKAIVVPRFPAPKPVPITLDRTIYLSPADPSLVPRAYQRVIGRPVPQRVRQPIVTHTSKPIIARNSVYVTKRLAGRSPAMPRVVSSPAPTLRIPQLATQSLVSRVLRRRPHLYPAILRKTVSNNQIASLVDPIVVPRFLRDQTPQVIGKPGINHPYRPVRWMGLLEDTRPEPQDPIVVAMNATIANMSRRRSYWPRTTIVHPYMYTGVAPTPTPGPQGIWFDIIAASIDWLRQDASIVSSFGDVKGTTDKFTSDAEPPGINPPYAVFYEPEEVESFETTDNDSVSSLVDGIYRIEIFSTGKLLTRRLSEAVIDRLNDAPLQFQNGVLIYLRRSVRKYPTLEVPGTGTNVAMFKRMVEFEYQFERSYTLDI